MRVTHSLFLLILPAALAAAGCYDAEALIKERLAEANRMRLEEVDLGEYRVTLPPNSETASRGVVEFHAFGQVAKQDRREVEKALEMRKPELQNAMLMAIRQMKIEQLEEPALKHVRAKIAEVVNQLLAEPFVQRIGFYQLKFLPL